MAGVDFILGVGFSSSEQLSDKERRGAAMRSTHAPVAKRDLKTCALAAAKMRPDLIDPAVPKGVASETSVPQG